VHSAIQKPPLRGFPIARTRVYSACIRDDFTLAEISCLKSALEGLDRFPTFDGGHLFCAPHDVVIQQQLFHCFCQCGHCMSIRAKLCHYVFASLFLKQPDSPTRSIML